MPRRASWSHTDVLAVAATQHGLVTSQQLTSLGVPRSTVSSSQELGLMFSWVLPGVHRVDGRGPLAPDQVDCAALLYAGDEALLTGARLARRLGVRAASHPAFLEQERPHVLIPHALRRASRGFVRVERTVAMPRARLVDGFRAAPTYRAVLDAVRRCTDQDAVRALVFEVVQRGMTTPQQLNDERLSGQIRGSRFARLALDEVFAGVRSIPEGDLRLAFVRAGRTGLLYNPRLYLPSGEFLACPDVYDPETGVCLDVDSREHHFQVQTWEATMRRHARMTSYGLAVLHAPPSRIAADVDGLVAEFGLAVRARMGTPPPRIDVRATSG